MEENFVVYYCSVCHVCKKPSESAETMKFCSGCKLVQYCSLKHQKQDWRNHRELCKVMQHIMKKWGMSHVYQEVVTMDPGDLVSWNCLRMSLVTFVKSALKRYLTTEEMQMILFPPVCSRCHLYNVNKMFICNLCKSVMYCSKEHQAEDKKHLSVCNYLFQSFEIDMLRLHSGNSMFNFIDFADRCRVKDFPKNMKIFIKSLTSTLSPQGVCMSELLSFSLTLIFLINKIAKVKANQLKLHIVGADSMELAGMQAFPLLYHLLHHVIHLDIVLIGPKVPDDDAIPLCIADSNISLCSVNVLYHEYLGSPKFVTPDMIVAFNCGFCEFKTNPDKDTWKQSLSHILSFKNTVVAITSYTEKESVADLQRLCSFKPKNADCNTTMECAMNPFSSLYPHRDWESEGVYFVNQYISVLQI